MKTEGGVERSSEYLRPWQSCVELLQMFCPGKNHVTNRVYPSTVAQSGNTDRGNTEMEFNMKNSVTWEHTHKICLTQTAETSY